MTKDSLERRAFVVDELRVERADDGGAKIAGHAAVFNQWSSDLGGFREQVAPGAFRKSLNAGADVRALFNHSPNLVLGRSKSGTLRLEEDKRGLAIEIDPPDTQGARDLMISIERGDVDQMSFGFRTVEDKWEIKEGEHHRTLVEVDLFDVSPVTFAAYPQTDVALRSLEAWQESETPIPEPAPAAEDGPETRQGESDDPAAPSPLESMRARTRQALAS